MLRIKINYAKNIIRCCTIGRSIWETTLACPINFDLNLTSNLTTNNYYEAENNIFSTQNITSSNIVSYRGGANVNLNPGFEVSPNSSSIFNAFIHPCSIAGNSPILKSNENENDEENVGDGFLNDELSNTNLSGNKLKIYPNPNDGNFTIDLGAENENSILCIYNIIGEKVLEYNNVKNKIQIDISALSKGIYTIKSFDVNGVRTEIIIYK